MAAGDVPMETFYISGNGGNVAAPSNWERYANRQKTTAAVAAWVIDRSMAIQGGSYSFERTNGMPENSSGIAYIYNYVWPRPDGTEWEGEAWVEVISQSACPSGYYAASATTCSPAGSPDPEKERGPDCNQDGEPSEVGNPCSAASGNKYQVEEDFRSPDNSLAYVRTYNSLANSFDYVNTNSYLVSRDSGFGVGWTVKAQLEINYYPDTATPAYIRVRSANGRAYTYTVDAGGNWSTDQDTTDRLTQDSAGYTITDSAGGTERYDLSGRILRATDVSGKHTIYSYDGAGNLSAITGPFGHALAFSWAGGHVTSMTDPAGHVTAYTYDGRNNLSRATYADGTAKIYHYENTSYPNHLTGISYVDAAGVESRYGTYDYNFIGMAVTTQHAGGQQMFSLAYDTRLYQTTVTDAAGTQEVWSFNPNLGFLNLIGKQNLADGKTVEQTFDARNNLTCRKDHEGRVTAYTYNSTNQRTSKTEGLIGGCYSRQSSAATRTTTYQYLASDLDLPTHVETSSVYAAGRMETVVGYNANRNPVSLTQRGHTPTGTQILRAITLGYNAAGQVTTVDGPRADIADIATLAYYDCTSGGVCGQLKSVTNALGQTTTYDSYDAAGRLTEQTDPNGVKTSYAYDLRGRVLSVVAIPPAGATRITQYSYNTAGNVTQVIAADGRTLTSEYDAALNLRAVTDNLGNRIEYAYDLRGNRTQTLIKDASGTLARQIDMAYDLRNRVAEINRGGSVTKLVQDAVGNLVSETAPNEVASGGQNATGHQYDALSRLTQTLDLLGGTIQTQYDVQDRPKQVTAPNGATTQYVYDDLGNLLEEMSPDRGNTRFTYDAAGNPLTRTDARGVVTTYGYDALNRVVVADYPGTSEDMHYSYDTGCAFGAGRLCTVTDASGNTRHDYDVYGNIATVTRNELGVSYVTRYGYDAGNRVVSISYPDGRVIGYTRDALGRVSGMDLTKNGVGTPILANVSYTADGLLAGQTFGNGLTEGRHYNLKGELTSQSLSATDSRTYGYDPNGNLTSLAGGSKQASYVYDPLDRLRQAIAGGVAIDYGYDANGNRLALAGGAESLGYSYAPLTNRLTAVQGADPRTHAVADSALTLDAAGNLVADSARGITLSYTGTGQIAQVLQAGIPLATYTYNAQRQRTRKDTAQGTMVYHYDLAGHLILETTASGSPVRAYAWRDNDPVVQVATDAQTSVDTLIYLHTDHLATPRLATDNSQAVVWRWDGLAFGESPPDEDPGHLGLVTVVNLRFPGQYYDQETGFHYNWNRYYDPKTGRYVTSDPVGLLGGQNTFVYVGNRPSVYVDPTGEFVPLVTGIIGGIAGAAGNLIVQKFVQGNCEIDWGAVVNAGVWGAAAGAALPFVGATWFGAAAVGSVANVGQYSTGQLLSGSEFTAAGVGISAVTGFVGGAVGGTFQQPVWYGTSQTALPELAAQQAMNNTLAENTGVGTLARNLGGGVVGNLDPNAPSNEGCGCKR